MDRLTDVLTTPDWMIDAACANHDPELWWVDDTKDCGAKIALAVCSTCPVRGDCLQHAQDMPEREGIWGGLLPRERRNLATVTEVA